MDSDFDDIIEVAGGGGAVIYDPPRFVMNDIAAFADGSFTATETSGVYTIAAVGSPTVLNNVSIGQIVYYNGVDGDGLTNLMSMDNSNLVIDVDMFITDFGLSSASAGTPIIAVNTKFLNSAINISTATFSEVTSASSIIPFTDRYAPNSFVSGQTSDVTTLIQSDGARYVVDGGGNEIYGIVYDVSISNLSSYAPETSCTVDSGSKIDFSGICKMIGVVL